MQDAYLGCVRARVDDILSEAERLPEVSISSNEREGGTLLSVALLSAELCSNLIFKRHSRSTICLKIADYQGTLLALQSDCTRYFCPVFLSKF